MNLTKRPLLERCNMIKNLSSKGYNSKKFPFHKAISNPFGIPKMNDNSYTIGVQPAFEGHVRGCPSCCDK